MSFIKIFLLFATLLTSLTTLAGDRLYRWVDDSGNVYYSDVVPPAEVDHERATLNKEGVVINVVGAEKSVEEIKISERLSKLRAQQQRLINEQSARDQVLLRTFASEQDLTVARDNKLSAIDIIIQVTNGNTARLKEQLLKLQSIAAQRERAGREIPEKLQEEISSSNTQIQENQTFIQTKEREKHEIRSRFDADLKRFLELKQQQMSQLSRATSKEHLPDNLSVFKCNTDEHCALAWKAAEKYVRTQSSTKIILVTNAVIMTAEPLLDERYGITVTLNQALDNGQEIFLDLQCRNTIKGLNLCDSPTANKVRNGFVPALHAASSPK